MNELKIDNKSIISPLFKEGFFDIHEFSFDSSLLKESESPLFTVILDNKTNTACTPEDILVIERLTGALIKMERLNADKKSNFNILNIKDIEHFRIHDLKTKFNTPLFIIFGDAIKKIKPALSKYSIYSVSNIRIIAADELSMIGTDVNLSKKFWACFSSCF